MFLKAASPIDYKFLTCEKKFLNNNGFCVEDNLIGIYGSLIKKFTLNNIIEIATNFYKSKNINWDRTMGYSSDCIMHICKIHNISAYAYDIMNQCFLKYVGNHRNYPALFYYAMNNHMYLVKDTDQCKSMVERAKDHCVSFNTSLIEPTEQKNLYDELPIYENLDITTLGGYDSCIVIYSREKETNVNDIFQQCLALYGCPSSKSIRASKSNITKFEYNFNKKHYMIVQDPNDLTVINWRKIKELCEKHEVPFKNQTFLSMMKGIRDKLKKEKSERKQFTEEEKRFIYDNIAHGKCAICDEKLKQKYEVDHIKPLVSGGTNDIKNLQLLCKSCHKEKTLTEKEDGSYIRIIETESSFNNQLNDIMSSPFCERYAFVENVVPLENEEEPKKVKVNTKYSEEDFKRKEDIIVNSKPWYMDDEGDYYEFFNYWRSLRSEEVINNEPKIYNIDIIKCRKNNLYYSTYDLPVFTVMDKVKVFNKDDELKTGIYYVETKKYFPLRGNGWYSLPMIEYCLKNDIITMENIKYCVQCLVTIPCDYYNEFIDYCYKTLPDDYKKLSINMMIGGFKPNLNKYVNWQSVCITSNSCEAYTNYLKYNGCFIEIIKVNNVRYFHVYKELMQTNVETEKPIYDQIMDLEAIHLHKLSQIIKSNNGQVLDLNTDCITCSFDNDVFPFKMNDNILEGFYYDDDKSVPMYKLEDKNTRLQVQRKALYKREDQYINESLKWNKIEDVNDNDFKPLVDAVINSDKSYFITGSAGTGKSQLIRDIKKELDIKQKTYKCMAPTNLAALNIKGTTIHKFVTKIKKMDVLYNFDYDYIFIDEISMVKEIFYKFFIMVKRIKPNVKFIIAGDFQQLPPINDRIQEKIEYEFNYKSSVALKELCDYNMLELSTCRRSDDILFNMCKFENINKININDFDNKICERNLAYTNRKRIEVNELCMNKYKVNYHGTKQYLEANKHDSNSQDVVLYPKLPIICKKNDEEMELINNEQFIVTKVSSTMIHFKNDNRELMIKLSQFQEYFYPAYCITIHKSQGQTYNFPYTIHEYERLTKKLKYVALTRATDMKFINIKI